MSSYKQACTSGSYSPCDTSCPQPITKSWSQPCVTSCGDSRAVVYPPPVVITFPGPIISSCPQESVVGSSAPLGIGSSLGYGGSLEGQTLLATVTSKPPHCFSQCVLEGYGKGKQMGVRHIY
uniref:Keratin n=1 Tax=Calidris pygmaea TaxID=425635 RepID=A0A8C3JEZ4_9CHAR